MSSRHTACKLCRERKVRCPGQQPTCERCRRAGEQCVYLPAQRPTKANLSETVEALQRRLNETEALILKMRGHPENAAAMLGSYGFDWQPNSDFQALAPSSLPEHPSAPSLGVSSLTSELGHQDLLYQQPGDLHPPELQSATWSEAGGSNEFQGGDPMDFDHLQLGHPFNHDGYEQEQTKAPPTHNGSTSSSTNLSTPTASSSGVAAETGVGVTADETGRTVLGALEAYCSSVIRRDCEVLGLATAVADYMAWMRKLPSTGAPLVTDSMYQQMMANIETRVRELVEVARKGHDEPLQNLMRALQSSPDGAMAARVAELEADLQKQVREQTEFFKNEYNTCKLLSEQAQKRP